MAFIEDGKLILDVNTDEQEFKTLCSMFDANDTGNTRAPVDVYEDRFSEMIEEDAIYSHTDAFKERQIDIEYSLAFFEENDIDYIEIRE